MKITSFTLPGILLSILLLSACSNSSNSLQLTPKLDASSITSKVTNDHDWLLNSQDLRSARYLISISAGDDVATLINESVSTRTVIEKTLQAHWAKQGHRFTTQADNEYQITVQLLQLVAQVEQHTFSHESHINAVIRIELNSASTTFAKTFRANFNKEGAFAANVDTIAEQLNTQLSQLLDQIVQDPELNAKLQQL